MFIKKTERRKHEIQKFCNHRKEKGRDGKKNLKKHQELDVAIINVK